MTERLYYTDPYRRTFEATIQRVEPREGRLIVVLDRTAFYPTSGGQPFDTGVLGPWRVVDVADEDDGTISHVAERTGDAADAAPGDLVEGVIDWPRRFDHMQQHTGQHVLSAAFARVFDVRTVSFHLGAQASTIDLARELTAAQIAQAEEEANRIVWEDRAVSIRFASSEDAARLPLRKEPVRGGTLRLIDVADWDLSACGGTHVASTGAIGAIAVIKSERFKGGQRIEFVCGGRALRQFQSMRDTLAASVRLLSVLPAELPDAIERLQGELKDQKRAAAAVQAELAAYRAAGLAAAAEPAISAQQVVAGLVASFGGRGGGRPELAQAGGLSAPADAILARARDLLNA